MREEYRKIILVKDPVESKNRKEHDVISNNL